MTARRVDLAIAAALLIGSGIWATHFWNTWTARGGKAEFYQVYFEPAVMVACGKGFVISERQPKILEDFLFQRRDGLDCRDLPPDLKVGRDHIYQGAWIYLQLAVGWSWRLLGISWSRLGPLFGLLFGIVVVLAYAIGRLAMGPLFALGPAVAVAVSSTQLLNLPHLRDYAKAPFTLALVLILGLLVTRPVRPRTVLLLAVAYGAVLGVGYGFRTDFLIDVPLILIVLFAFLDGGLLRNLALKAAASVLCLATFMAVAWPVFTAVYARGGCQWHVALLGLQLPFDSELHLTSAPYDFGYVYGDGYVVAMVSGYARRTQSITHDQVYCSHEYDLEGGRYLKEIVTSFPADMAVRAYASMQQIMEIPFQQWEAPMPGWAPRLYRVRAMVLKPRMRAGLYVTIAALMMVSAVSTRLGLFLMFFLVYFGGYPAIQFQGRHYFHLEFVTWWTLAFVAYHMWNVAWSWRVGIPDLRPFARPAVRGVALVLAGVVALAALLGVARWYQQREARQLFNGYLAAPTERLPDDAGSLRDAASGQWPQLLEVVLNAQACRPGQAVTFRYDPAVPTEDFTRTMTIPMNSPPGVTRIFLPVFERFSRLDLGDAPPGCFSGAYRVPDLPRFRLLLGATLPPGWDSAPLYQRFGA